MATPSQKAPALTDFLEQTFGRSSAITSDTCVSCGQDATDFRDALSEKEYTISGLCQSCQDSIFGV